MWAKLVLAQLTSRRSLPRVGTVQGEGDERILDRAAHGDVRRPSPGLRPGTVRRQDCDGLRPCWPERLPRDARHRADGNPGCCARIPSGRERGHRLGPRLRRQSRRRTEGRPDCQWKRRHGGLHWRSTDGRAKAGRYRGSRRRLGRRHLRYLGCWRGQNPGHPLLQPSLEEDARPNPVIRHLLVLAHTLGHVSYASMPLSISIIQMPPAGGINSFKF